MMPHPTTMTFAWDKEVLRASHVLFFVFGLTIALLFGSAALVDHEVGPSTAITAEQSTSDTQLSASLADFPEPVYKAQR